MWEAIRRNRRRSWVLIGVMGTLLVVLGFVIGMALEPQAGGAIGAIGALILWLILFTVALLQGDAILLASSRARQISRAEAPQLWNVVEEMTIASGLGKMPRVFIIDEESPNAFAVGRKPETAAVAITSGLLKRLNRDELQGVIAHEIAHIKNLDIRFLTLASVMMGSIALLSHFFLRSIFYGAASRRGGSSRGGGQAQLALLAIAIVVAILAPIFAQMLYFACSRRREYLADASGARFTRYPDGLASALEKLAILSTGMKNVNKALAPLYIVSPLKGLAAAGLFSTHPPIERRIKILRSMGGRAGYVDYDAAYQKVVGTKSHLIGLRTLTSDSSVAAREPSAPKDSKKEAIDRAREVASILDHMAAFIPIVCVCGVRIKVPPELKRDTVPCPKCGRTHEVPHAEQRQPDSSADAASRPATAAEQPLTYRRTGEGWESFKCKCGKVLQLSPGLMAPTLTCRGCGRKVEIETPATQR